MMYLKGFVCRKCNYTTDISYESLECLQVPCSQHLVLQIPTLPGIQTTTTIYSIYSLYKTNCAVVQYIAISEKNVRKG
jgi:hypothetical protein